MTALSVKFFAAKNIIAAASAAFCVEECPKVVDIFVQKNTLKVEDINDVLGTGRTVDEIKAALVLATHWDQAQYAASSTTACAIYEARRRNDEEEADRLQKLNDAVQYSDRATRNAAEKVLRCLLDT